MAGLTVQNFVSAAVGMAVAVALVRGFARRRTGELGNFWVDLVRGTLRILLPLAFVGAVILVAGGAIQNFHCTTRWSTPWAAARRPSPAARSPARRPSRSSAPTAAASTTPTPPIRSRTRRRGPTGRDLPAAGHQLLAAAHVRPDGRQHRRAAIVAVMGARLSASRSLLFQLQPTDGADRRRRREEASNSASA